MEFETFKRAVDSLDGYEGLISTIGGEPLLHPEYSRFAAYLRRKRGKNKLTVTSRGNAILKDYLHYAKFQRWVEASINAGRGYLLFTSIPKHYYKYFEDVQETVSDLWLNDHTAISMHQPILISRKDLGISDEEFVKLRDNCWLQNFWSGTITPKGCFFCEIAGTLDMLFDGPGGKPIEPGWWKKDISEFSDQFHWCDICGMALQTFSRNANEGIDDVSASNYEKLRKMNSPKFVKKKVNLVTSKPLYDNRLGKDMASVMGNYQPDNDVRVGDVKRNMQPERILRVESLGLPFVKAAQNCAEREWLMFTEHNANLPPNFEELICSRYLNPGYLFHCKFGAGEAVLLSPIAHAAKRLGFDGLRDCSTIDKLVTGWGAKVHVLESGFEELPDFDIAYFRNKVFDNYNNDSDFKTRLRQRLREKNIKPKANLLVMHSAFVFHTLSIVRLLQNMGHNVYVIGSEKFKEYFTDWVKHERISYFSNSHFDFACQSELREEIKCHNKFDGAIVPFSFGPSTVKFIDDYTDTLRTAEDVGGRILGIINIRRQFIEPEYDIWGKT
ncbi:MAG: hypothetical protein CSA25_04165 [Desulfobacter postgatei]|uniref:Radical SAM protein n=1 Tax=Desulfobacter postgatei TaxID=2293 RepID=A0A2G6MRE3_9BACT|nr:MAG: hypothetical protein CSA25_04165 [Desulfobacter postgatei]